MGNLLSTPVSESGVPLPPPNTTEPPTTTEPNYANNNLLNNIKN